MAVARGGVYRRTYIDERATFFRSIKKGKRTTTLARR